MTNVESTEQADEDGGLAREIAVAVTVLGLVALAWSLLGGL